MGQGSKFDSALGTRGGRGNFVTGNDISSGDALAIDILSEMEKEGTKFSRDKIVFAARLENGSKIFMETDAVNHIIQRHSLQFKNAFGVEKHQIKGLLSDTISKGKLVQSYRHDSNGLEGYRNVYYYKGNYCVTYAIASNGYITTAFPIKIKGGKK